METREKKTGKIGLVLAAVVIAAFVLFAGFNIHRARSMKAHAEPRQRRVPVTVDKVIRRPFQRVMDLTGEIRPWNETVVLPKIPGQVIQRILPRKGDRLLRGDLVAVLDDRSTRARLAEAEAALAAARAGQSQAEAGLRVLEKDRERLENLYREKAVARQRLDHLAGQAEGARQARNLAEARTRQAEAVIGQLRIALGDHRVTAPVDGTVIARFLDPGVLSDPGTPILRLADESRVKILTFVPEKDFSQIKTGMAAEVRVDAYPQEVFSGKVSIVTPAFSPATRSNDVEIHMDNPGERLKTGMFARVRIHLGEKTATAVDQDALIRMPGTGSDYLFAVVDGRAVQRNVKTGQSRGKMVEILQGIAPGARVVVSGHGALRDGDPVLVSASDNAAPGGEEGAQ